MEQEEILAKAAEIIKAQNEERMRIVQEKLMQFCEENQIDLITLLQIKLR